MNNDTIYYKTVEYEVLPLDDDGNEYVAFIGTDKDVDLKNSLYLTSTAFSILSFISSPKSLHDIAHFITEEYEVSHSQAREDVRECLESMVTYGIVFQSVKE